MHSVWRWLVRRPSLLTIPLVGGLLLCLLATGVGELPAIPGDSATLVVSPHQLAAGASTLLSGAGFDRHGTGAITLDGAEIATFRTNEHGAFSRVVAVPAGTAAGAHRFAARTATTSASSQLLVVATPDGTVAAPRIVPAPDPPPPGAAAAPHAAPAPDMTSTPPVASALPAAAPTPSTAPAPSTAAVQPDGASPTSRTRNARQPIAFGAYIPGALQDPAQLDAYTRLVGVPPAVVLWYHDWGHGGFHRPMMDAIAAHGAMPLVTWEPHDYAGEARQPDFALAAIAAGRHDAYVRQYARDAAAWGRPFYLRFAHEMNGDWYPWGTAPGNPTGNSPADFVAAWRRAHAIFQAEGATNARWVWSPNVADPTTTPFAQIYPGDTYVDWVGLVGYNWGTGFSWSGWASLAGIFGPSYDELAALTDKPMMVTEVASSEVGGDKAAWIIQGLLADIPTRFPRVRAVIWFNVDLHADWRIDTSPASLAAYRRVAASPLYQGRLP